MQVVLNPFRTVNMLFADRLRFDLELNHSSRKIVIEAYQLPVFGGELLGFCCGSVGKMFAAVRSVIYARAFFCKVSRIADRGKRDIFARNLTATFYCVTNRGS